MPGLVPDGPDPPGVKIPPTYTAFPNLRAPKREDFEETGVPELPNPKSADGDPVLRQIQVARVREGAEYLRRVRHSIPTSSMLPSFSFLGYAATEAETYRAAAELEDTAAGKVRWYEAMVVGQKGVERLFEFSLRYGNEQSQSLNLARFRRLQAEADLLNLEQLVGTTGGGTVPPSVPFLAPYPVPVLKAQLPPCRPRLLFRRFQ